MPSGIRPTKACGTSPPGNTRRPAPPRPANAHSSEPPPATPPTRSDPPLSERPPASPPTRPPPFRHYSTIRTSFAVDLIRPSRPLSSHSTRTPGPTPPPVGTTSTPRTADHSPTSPHSDTPLPRTKYTPPHPDRYSPEIERNSTAAGSRRPNSIV